jgi:hypothetical protein
MLPEEQVQYRKQRRREGAGLVKEDLTMHVGSNGLWWADSADKLRTLQSFERIGYHTLAEELLYGFLEAGGKCYFHAFKGVNGEVHL